jgi:hypothetical protein
VVDAWATPTTPLGLVPPPGTGQYKLRISKLVITRCNYRTSAKRSTRLPNRKRRRRRRRTLSHLPLAYLYLGEESSVSTRSRLNSPRSTGILVRPRSCPHHCDPYLAQLSPSSGQAMSPRGKGEPIFSSAMMWLIQLQFYKAGW